MGICRIQKPTSYKEKHGDIFIKIVCDGEENDVIKYEGEKDDLHLNLLCEEEEGAFYIGSDFKDEIEKMNKKIIELQDGINGNIDLLIDLNEAENYIKNNPI